MEVQVVRVAAEVCRTVQLAAVLAHVLTRNSAGRLCMRGLRKAGCVSDARQRPVYLCRHKRWPSFCSTPALNYPTR